MGVIPDINETAKSAIDALKQTPVVLALLLFNIAFMGMQFYQTHEEGARWERSIRMQAEYCDALVRTVGGYRLQSE